MDTTVRLVVWQIVSKSTREINLLDLDNTLPVEVALVHGGIVLMETKSIFTSMASSLCHVTADVPDSE